MLKAILVACGTNTGKTTIIRGKEFVNGEHVVLGGAKQELDYKVRYIERTCNAFLKGSTQLLAMQKRDQANGIQRPAAPAAKPGNSNGIQGGVGESAGRVSAPSTDLGTGAEPNGASDGATGLGASGGGHADSGLRPEQVIAVRTAVLSLDPMDEKVWTEAGLPSVEAIVALTGDQSITRAVIAAVEPTHTREEALDKAAQADI